MPLPVSLFEVVGQMDMGPGWTVYISRKTGEIIQLPNESNEIKDDIEEMEEVQEDRRRVEESEDFEAMPDQLDIDEYGIMERFADSRDSPNVSAALLDAIKGKGAFRRFKDCAHRFGMMDQWYDFRERAIADKVADHLKFLEIPFDDDIEQKRRLRASSKK